MIELTFRSPGEQYDYIQGLIEVAVQRVMIINGELAPTLSKRAAYKIYGRGLVDRWIKEGLIKPVKDGNDSSTMRLDRVRLELLSKTPNRQTYLTSIERK